MLVVGTRGPQRLGLLVLLAIAVAAAAPGRSTVRAQLPAPDQIGTWQAIEVEGATCGGPPPRAPYSYFLNPGSEDADGILFVLGGGGACLKEGPAPPGATGIAAQLHCMDFQNFRDPYFNSVTFASDLAPAAAIPFFRRNAPENPFADFHFVAVPYCTGDVHAGLAAEPHDYDPDPSATFEVLHRGHLNVRAVIDDVYARLPGDLPVVLTGFSAGGFGAVYNFPTVLERWPRTSLLPDSGMAPTIPGSLLSREAEAVEARWGARALLPAYCKADRCLTDTLHLLAAHAGAHDGTGGNDWRPMGVLQSQQDGTLSDYLEISGCGYEMALRRGLSEIGPAGNVRVFVPASDHHVFGVVNPLQSPFRSQLGVDPIAWFGRVAMAETPDALPEDATDPWLPCNPVFLPSSGLLPPAR